MVVTRSRSKSQVPANNPSKAVTKTAATKKTTKSPSTKPRKSPTKISNKQCKIPRKTPPKSARSCRVLPDRFDSLGLPSVTNRTVTKIAKPTRKASARKKPTKVIIQYTSEEDGGHAKSTSRELITMHESEEVLELPDQNNYVPRLKGRFQYDEFLEWPYGERKPTVKFLREWFKDEYPEKHSIDVAIANEAAKTSSGPVPATLPEQLESLSNEQLDHIGNTERRKKTLDEPRNAQLRRMFERLA